MVLNRGIGETTVLEHLLKISSHSHFAVAINTERVDSTAGNFGDERGLGDDLVAAGTGEFFAEAFFFVQ